MDDNAAAITKHTVALNATVLNIDRQPGLIPVAIYAALWASATATFALALAEAGDAAMGTTARTYKATDDAAVTLVDDKWNTLPEPLGVKLASGDWQVILASAEAGGPFTAQIAWAPVGVR